MIAIRFDSRAARIRLARMLQVCLAVCIATVAVAQPSLEQKLDAVKEFKRYFRKFKEVSQKVEAVRTLETNECPQAAAELVKLFSDKRDEVVRAAIEVLSKYKKGETFRDLIANLPTMSNAEQQAALIEVLGKAEIRWATTAICELVVDKGASNRGVKYSAARTLGKIGGKRAPEALELLLADGEMTVRMAACDSIGLQDVDALGVKLVTALEDNHWQVRAAAAGALGKVRNADAVEPLIALMRKGGRVVEECADALFNITGMDLGTDADSWQSQWDRLKSIKGWRIPTDEELAKKREARKRYDALYGKTEKATEFGGIKTSSTKVLFVLDISGSMEDLVVERDKFDAGYKNYQKLTIVKTELERTIEGLEANTWFNIAAFATKVKPWKKFLVPANIVNKASAIRFVQRLKALGGKEAQGLAGAGLGGSANLAAGKTNTLAALMYPFGIDPEKGLRRGPKTGVPSNSKWRKLDTVFFLSDGRPSTGKLVDEREILEIVTEINGEYRITFHVIAIGEFQKTFLKSLAEQNGGVFVDLGK